ncbi:MAG TPA: alpha/beta fold hydrolase [Actinoplanes sp.]|nr:alpha/beta fold hydrolase [Actinoplanes sp.]
MKFLSHHTAGSGPTVLLVHGAAEDAGLLDDLGHALAARGCRAIWYDRRGTGGSTRDDWPGGGADQHADDAAALLADLGATGATVAGFSSGGVVALALAARHPAAAAQVIAWEPPALGMLPGAADMHAAIMAPINAYLTEHPGDWVGGYHVMLGILSEGRADLSSPEVKRMAVNAEAALRDDGPRTPLRGFAPGELPAGRTTVAVGETADPLHADIAARIAALVSSAPVVVPGADDHEVYLSRPDVMAAFLARIRPSSAHGGVARPPASSPRAAR